MRGLSEFCSWLPGELIYSAKKAPYNKKLERAELPIDDGKSVVSFLGTEWFNAGMLRKQGALYSPEHAKSAQGQFAKFAAGIFDKAILVKWIMAGKPTDVDEMIDIARQHTPAIQMQITDEGLPKMTIPDLDASYDTAFRDDIVSIQRGIAELNPGANEDAVVLANKITATGLTATACYVKFATELNDNQLTIPASVLADSSQVYSPR